MSEEEQPVDMSAIPLDSSWMDGAPEHVKETAAELLTEFNSAMLYLHAATQRPESDYVHEAAHAVLGSVDSLINATFRIAQIETAKSGELGINMQVVIAVQRTMLSAFTLAGIRYGQRHPDAYLAEEIHPGEIEEAIEAELRRLQSEAEEGTQGED